MKAVIDCIKLLEHDFYDLHSGKSLAELDDIYDLDRLIFKYDDSDGARIMSYILLSCYNASGTVHLLMDKLLDEKIQNDRVIMFDISDANARKS